MTLKQYAPPGNMVDFDNIPNQRQQWSDAISGWIDDAIAAEADAFKRAKKNGKVQFFNPLKNLPAGLSLDQDIVWNAFPRTLLLGLGDKELAYKTTEQTFSLTANPPALPFSGGYFVNPPGTNVWDNLYYRPLDEYCEWRVERDPKTQKILKITFTSEPPEYWQALHGDELQDLNGNYAHPFTGDPKLLLDLYHKYVSKEVKADDLVFTQDMYGMAGKKPMLLYKKGSYNPWNVYNTTKGIMHLCQPNNSISAEIQLGADATLLRQKKGHAVVQADPLICGANYGGPTRTSDPTIGASVNALAQLGAWITLKDPIGLYMNDLNAEGFTKPNGEPIAPDEYFKVLRGDAKSRMIERAVFEVPASEGFTVSDLRIGGEPIRWGGQVAEHINIRLTGTAVAPGSFKNPMLPCDHFCCIDPAQPLALTRPFDDRSKIPPGYVETFLFEQGVFGLSSAAAARLAPEKAILAVPDTKTIFLRHKHR